MEEINQSIILPVGAKLNSRYRIERHLASGGFGITYAAIDEFGDRVAIKEFFMRGVNQRDEDSTTVSVSNSEKRAENDRMREKFRKEAMRLRGLKNEHIVKVLAFFEENGTSYYVMNYIDGESLARRMEHLGGSPMTEQEVRSILNDMLEALDEVHRSNPPLYHLDIKPGNIMVDSRGSAYLIDFGSSKQTDAGSGTSSLVTLTPEYAPLELIEGSADKFGPWTDLYSLGATLYRILTAQKPPKTSDISDQGTAAFHFPDSVSRPMRELIQWMMQPTRAKRPQSIAEVRRRLGENVSKLEGDDEETRVGGFSHSDHSNLTPINHAKLRAWAKDPKNKDKQFFIRRFGTKTYFPGELLTVNLFEEDEVRPNDSITDYQNLGELVSNYKPSRFSYFAATFTFIVFALLILILIILSKTSEGGDDSNEIKYVTEKRMTTKTATTPYDQGYNNRAASSSSSSLGNRTFTVGGVTFTMVAVEGGTFTMGATAEQGNDAGRAEKPAHKVTLSNYYIGQTEVTQALWQAVMGSNPSRITGNLQRPVELVSWDDCKEFITKLNRLTGANFRLPTEAEWEYAARGGNKSRGYKYSGSNSLDAVAWYDGNNGGTMHPVGTKSPNELGLYDMSGNVWEWCQDWYDNYSSGSQYNPTGPTSGSSRVFRGGSEFDAGHCRVSFRDGYSPSHQINLLGFRLAL